jgi:hypothetical protein
MPAPLIGVGIKLLLDTLGPVLVQRVKRAVQEANGHFSSDWRRARYVRRELRLGLREETRLLKVPRSVQRWLVELMVLNSKAEAGDPLAGIRLAATPR